MKKLNLIEKIAKTTRINPVKPPRTLEGAVNGLGKGVRAAHSQFQDFTKHMGSSALDAGGNKMYSFGQKGSNAFAAGYNKLIGNRLGLTMNADKHLTQGDILQKQMTQTFKGLGAGYRALTGRDTKSRMMDAIVNNPENNQNNNPGAPGGGRR